MNTQDAIYAMKNLGVSLNDYDSDALEVLIHFAEAQLAALQAGDPVAWRAFNSNGDVLTEWVDSAPTDFDRSEVDRVQGRMQVAYSNGEALKEVMCEGRVYPVQTPRTIAHAELIRDHAAKWLQDVTGTQAPASVPNNDPVGEVSHTDVLPGKDGLYRHEFLSDSRLPIGAELYLHEQPPIAGKVPDGLLEQFIERMNKHRRSNVWMYEKAIEILRELLSAHTPISAIPPGYAVTDDEVWEIFLKDSVKPFCGNYEITPGQALNIARKLLASAPAIQPQAAAPVDEQAMKDAARLDWLEAERLKHGPIDFSRHGREWTRLFTISTQHMRPAPSIRAAIDAAMLSKASAEREG